MTASPGQGAFRTTRWGVLRSAATAILLSFWTCTPAQVSPRDLGEPTAIATGLQLRRAAVRDASGRPQYVAVLQADPRAPGVHFEFAAAHGLDETSDLARRAGATAAINGGFFSKDRKALGAFRIAGQELGVADLARQAALVLDGRAPVLRADPTGTFAGARDVLAAGPMLVVGGLIPSPAKWNDARHPRSAIGTTNDGLVLLVSVDGRAEQAAGMTFDELAATMRALGCTDALNLDGGGSTTLWLATQPGSGVVNHPCDDKLFDAAGERAVRNAVLVFADPVAEPVVPPDELALRTARDFSLSQKALLTQLGRRVRDFASAEFDAWERLGLFDSRTVDGATRYHKSAVSNLFFRDPAARARRASGSTWHAPRLDTGTKTFALRMTLTIAADAVPKGETIRAWLPCPQRDDRQHPLAEACADVADAPMRARLLTSVAQAGKPTVFTAACDVERRGVRNDLDPARAIPCPPGAFTEERPPHVVFSPAIRALAAAIMGDERNPLVIARRCYDWCADHLTYSFAREYSTIPCIPAELLASRRGDCGQSTLLFMTLCRCCGIPARWQSGWVLVPGQVNMHDWCEIRVEPWGWIPVDVNAAVELRHADGLDAAERQRIRDFYFGNLDSWRVVFCRDHGRPLVPPKSSPRSDDVDFQRGECEWGSVAKNLYFDVMDFELRAVVKD